MQDFIATFHIDWYLILAQVVNFTIVAFVVWKFGLKPLMGVLDKRGKDVAESLRQVEAIRVEFKELEAKKQATEAVTRKEMQELVRKAEADAQIRRQEILERVKEEAAQVVAVARTKFEAEQEEAIRSMRQEAARLVVQAVTKVVGKLPEGLVDKKLAEEAIEEVARRRS